MTLLTTATMQEYYLQWYSVKIMLFEQFYIRNRNPQLNNLCVSINTLRLPNVVGF